MNGLPAELKVGLFQQPRSYSAWIRFANATSASDREKDVRGMSIKVRGVRGENLTPGSDVQDFVLNSHPVMMVPGPREFLQLLRAVEAGGLKRALYFLSHPKRRPASRSPHDSSRPVTWTSRTGARRRISSATAAPSSTSSGRCRGTSRQPTVTDTISTTSSAATVDGGRRVRLLRAVSTDARTMPIEDASVEWSERDSPYVRVAEVRIPRQAIDVPGREQACERTSFNPWHCWPSIVRSAHEPRAREIYQAMQQFRESRVARTVWPRSRHRSNRRDTVWHSACQPEFLR